MPPPLEVVGWVAPSAWQQPVRDIASRPAWSGVADGDRSLDPGGTPPGRLSGSITVIALAIAAVIALIRVSELGGSDSSMVTSDTQDGSIVSTLGDLASAVVFFAYLAWSWQMASNHRQLTGAEPGVGRFGAIGWWFVPIANLFMPAVFVNNIMVGFAIPGRRTHRWLVPVWWLAYLAAIGLGIAWGIDVANRWNDAGALGPLPLVDTGFLRVSAGLTAVAAVALIAIVVLTNRNVAIRYRAALQGWPPPP